MAEGDKRLQYTVPSEHWDYMKFHGILVATNRTTWTWEAVATRLKEAARTLQTMPTDKPKGYRAMWPDAPHDARTAYGYYGDPLNLYKRERQMPDVRFTPEPGAIDRMDECLGWLHWLSKDHGYVVEAVARGVRILTIARKRKVQPITIRRQFRRGCQIIAGKLNG